MRRCHISLTKLHRQLGVLRLAALECRADHRGLHEGFAKSWVLATEWIIQTKDLLRQALGA